MEPDAEQQCEARLAKAAALDPGSVDVAQATASMRISQQRLDDANAEMTKALRLLQGMGEARCTALAAAPPPPPPHPRRPRRRRAPCIRLPRDDGQVPAGAGPPRGRCPPLRPPAGGGRHGDGGLVPHGLRTARRWRARAVVAVPRRRPRGALAPAPPPQLLPGPLTRRRCCLQSVRKKRKADPDPELAVQEHQFEKLRAEVASAAASGAAGDMEEEDDDDDDDDGDE